MTLRLTGRASTHTPTGSEKSRCGSQNSAVSTPIAAADACRVRTAASGIASALIWSPNTETDIAAHRRMNAGCRLSGGGGGASVRRSTSAAVEVTPGGSGCRRSSTSRAAPPSGRRRGAAHPRRRAPTTCRRSSSSRRCARGTRGESNGLVARGRLHDDAPRGHCAEALVAGRALHGHRRRRFLDLDVTGCRANGRVAVDAVDTDVTGCRVDRRLAPDAAEARRRRSRS